MSTASLRRALRNGSRHEQAEAAVELGRHSDSASADDLRRLADSPDDLVAVAAMFGCWLLGRDVPLQRAAAALGSADEETMQAAVHALCEMGDAAVPGLAALLEADSPNSAEIVRVLGDIGGAKAQEAVLRASRSSRPELAATARDVLEDWENGDED